MANRLSLLLLIIVVLSGVRAAFAEKPTLDLIMSDADWMGTAPESPYWSHDSLHIYYWQKVQYKEAWRLLKHNVQTGQSETVKERIWEQDRGTDGVYNKDKTHKAFIRSNNVFVKNLIKKTVRQYTKSSARKFNIQFLQDNRVAFRQGNAVYVFDLKQGLVEPFVDIRLEDDPEAPANEDGFYIQQQKRLFKFIKKEDIRNKSKNIRQERLSKQYGVSVNLPWYFGTDKALSYLSLSPQGTHALAFLRENGSHFYGKPGQMPVYVNREGYTATRPVRAKVGTGESLDEAIWLLDLEQRTRIRLGKNHLPEINIERLTFLKKKQALASKQPYTKSARQRATHINVSSNVPLVRWNREGSKAAFMLFSHDNKDRWFVAADTRQQKLVVFDHEYNEAWVNDRDFNDFGWINKSDQLYFQSEKSGYGHLYFVQKNGAVVQQTRGEFEVSRLTPLDDKGSFIFLANKEHPGIYEVYQKNAGQAELVPITNKGGKNDYWLSPDKKKMVLLHSTVTRPPELFIQKRKSGASRKQITRTVSSAFSSIEWITPSIVPVPSSKHNRPIYSRLYRPRPDHDKGKAVLFVHGAGYLQNAHQGWSPYFREFMFHTLLVNKGYTVLDMDYRASKGYGSAWRSSIYRQMGTPELEDLTEGVSWLVKEHKINPEKVGIYGGSYGGFLTFMALFNAAETFAAGAALRPVTDWAHYEHGYTSNILNTPALDPEAYQKSSPIEYAEGLRSPLLIAHGMLDDNVFFADSVRLVQRLIELNKKDFELAVYPREGHAFKDPASWLDQYRRVLALFERHL